MHHTAAIFFHKQGYKQGCLGLGRGLRLVVERVFWLGSLVWQSRLLKSTTCQKSIAAVDHGEILAPRRIHERIPNF